MGEARSFPVDPGGSAGRFRFGVTSGLAPLPAWKHEADFLFVQVGFSVDELAAWRSSVDFDGGVFAGVMVVASPAMARKLSADLPQLAVPEDVIARLERDPGAGVELACTLVGQIKASGLFDGVHLIPVSRYRDIASRLETELEPSHPPGVLGLPDNRSHVLGRPDAHVKRRSRNPGVRPYILVSVAF